MTFLYRLSGFFFFKQKTAYEMRISDWSSDVCSSDLGMSVWRAREAKNAETFGSARWAVASEVRAAGLLGADGVVLGKHERDYLRHDGPEHVLCFAPTRSGKGVGLVVPSLLTWPGSAIVHDIKGENWTLTAGFRARHGRVLLFDPTNTKSAAYNRSEEHTSELQSIMRISYSF